jgi:hypothetical protein
VTVMLTILIALMVGTLSGTAAGGLAGWLTVRFLPRERMVDHLDIDPHVDGQINDAAAQWAEAHHAPAAAPLVADKLRLAYVLEQRRRRRHERRWSR